MPERRYERFGRKLKAWREAMRPAVTQKDLAGKVGVTDGFIAHIETGRTLPGNRTLRALAGALGVPELEMFREAGYLSETPPPSDEELIGDPELRLFFRDEWKYLSDDEKEWFKGFVRMIKVRRREKPGG
jgi:transcriptional regulator with XRE-family HTH domain